jgi:quercetin dioxygenase-like cupin family protein
LAVNVLAYRLEDRRPCLAADAPGAVRQSAFARRSEGVMVPRHRQGGVTRRTIAMSETIDLGALKLNFLQSKDTTGGSIDMFEMTVQPNARMPIPHYHDRWDETVYGLTGTTTFRVDGKDIDVGPGETVFIKRGIVHWFTNRTAEPSTCLCILSPGVLGPQYFKDIAKLLLAGAPDPAKMKETMLRYGLIPAPAS